MPRRIVFWIGWTLLLAGALFAAGNALLFMTVEGFGGAQFKSRFLALPWLGWSHTLGGAAAVLIGALQLLDVVRRRWPRFHVWCGRLYLLAVAVSGVSSLYFAATSPLNPVSGVGFGLMAVAWLSTAALGFAAIRRRDVAAHRRWMIRSYAVTYAAVSLRIELGLLIAAGVDFPTAFRTVAWLSWLGNLVLAEIWLRRRRQPAPADRVLAAVAGR